jgi:hypothetical protein
LAVLTPTVETAKSLLDLIVCQQFGHEEIMPVNRPG